MMYFPYRHKTIEEVGLDIYFLLFPEMRRQGQGCSTSVALSIINIVDLNDDVDIS